MSTDYVVRPLSDRSWLRPVGKRRVPRFRASFPTIRGHLLDEIDKLGGRDVVVECDVRESDLRVDGMLRANARPDLPAVVVAFTARELGPMLYRCDRYTGSGYTIPGWHANLRAIGLTLEALRHVDDYGVVTRGEQYAGWRQIEAAPAPKLDVDNLSPAEAWGVLVQLAELPLTEAMVANRHSMQQRLTVLKRARRRAHPDANAGRREHWALFEKAERALTS